jgi:hypothetical protein
MFRRTKHWLWLILCWFMLAGHVWAMPCDVDDDGDIDRDDLTLIQKAILARAPVSGPNDPRDPDSNSRIDSIDGRLCALRCTRARCSTTNQPPFANAGPDQSVRVGDLVALSGAASSDPDGDPLRYLWTFSNRPLGSLASLIDAATVAPHFIADKPGQYLIQLIVSDGKADSAPTRSPSAPKTAARSPTPAPTRASASAPGQPQRRRLDRRRWRPLRYTWQLGSVPPGSSAPSSNPESVNPTLLIDRPGNYLIALTVSDATLSSLPDTVAVSTENSPPVANAGANQAIPLGGSIALDGSRSSDVDGDPLTFRWSLLARPAGSQAVLSDATAVSPRFIADYPGTYVAQLIVNDGSVDSAPASVSLSTANAAPVANAGPGPDRPARQPGQPRRQRVTRPRRRPRQLQLVADRQTRRQPRHAQRQQQPQSRLQCRPAGRLHRPVDRQRWRAGQRTRHGHHFHRQLAAGRRRRPAAERRRRHQCAPRRSVPRTTSMVTS